MRLGREVAAHLGEPQDLEFALENDRVWILQARPITAPLGNLQGGEQATSWAKASAKASVVASAKASAKTSAKAGAVAGSASDAGVLRGVGGSAGVASGPARVVEGVEDFGRVEAGDILVCRFTDPAWTPLFGVVAGVVTEVGGRLSHAAIVAREHRIPAVLGVPGVMSALADGQPITIVGNTGLVRRDVSDWRGDAGEGVVDGEVG
jgi:pyruvate,water dikinase